MNWNDYEAVWKRQAVPVGSTADVAELRQTFEAKSRKLARTLLVRDVGEAAAGLLVTGVLAYVWWHVGREAWPLALAIILMLGVTGFFVRERIRTHRQRLGAEASVLAKLDAELAELRHQRRLLQNVWTWYLAPCAGVGLIVLVTFGRLLLVKAPPGFFEKLWSNPWPLMWIILNFGVILPLIFWGVWALNQRAVRKNIEPRIDELEELRQDLFATR